MCKISVDILLNLMIKKKKKYLLFSIKKNRTSLPYLSISSSFFYSSFVFFVLLTRTETKKERRDCERDEIREGESWERRVRLRDWKGDREMRQRDQERRRDREGELENRSTRSIGEVRSSMSGGQKPIFDEPAARRPEQPSKPNLKEREPDAYRNPIGETRFPDWFSPRFSTSFLVESEAISNRFLRKIPKVYKSYNLVDWFANCWIRV